MALFEKKKAPLFPGFKCPYCFEEIYHDRVCFLVKEANIRFYTDEELQWMDEAQAKEIREQQKAAEPFAKRDKDDQLDEFWAEIGGKEAYSTRKYCDDEIHWDSPIIYPFRAGEMTLNGYETDDDGFVTSVTDAYSKHKSEVRVCPFCHNPLPKLYGKYPVKSISVVGVAKSGKTIYLHQLISDLTKYLGEIGIDKYIVDEEAEGFTKIDSVDSIVPEGTTVELLTPPATVVIKKGPRFNTLVFYDISGENCIDPNRMNKYGKFISHSDGVIMLIDPLQFPTIAVANSGDYTEINKKDLDVATVLSAMKETFLIDRLDDNGKVTMPFAFAVSKSDFLVNELSKIPKLKKAIVLQEVRTKNRKVNTSDIILMKKTVREIIEEFAPDTYLIDSIKQNFSNFVFLAVSSLGCDIREVFTSSDGYVRGTYYLKPGPLEKTKKVIIRPSDDELIKLNNYLKYYDIINDADKTRYLAYSEEKGLEFNRPGFSIEDYKSGRMIQFEIVPDKETANEIMLDGKGNETNGSLFAIKKVPGYMPQPKRVEEPLHWLLAVFGLAEREQ